MELRTGKVVEGVIVLDDDDELKEGAAVTVLVSSPQAPVNVSDEELAVIDAGLAQSRSAERIDARTFLRELRRGV